MDLTGQNVLVYGTGKSGTGAAGLLCRLSANVVFFDEKTDIDCDAVRKTLPVPEACSFCLGELTDEVLGKTDLAVLSPGIPLDCPNALRIKEAGIPVIGEVELAWRAGKGEVLAITGTNGKTTTTALLGAIMSAARDEVYVVGNIGNAYTNEALKMSDDAVTVAEISSFQLETSDTFRPKVSAILNITEDHLNRHHTMEEYIRVKELIAAHQDKSCFCVLNYEDEVLRAFGEVCPARPFFFSSQRELDEGIFLRGSHIIRRFEGNEKDLLDVEGLPLIGTHNHENIMAACAMAFFAGVDDETVVSAVERFAPVEHRIEYVDTVNGARWYNDSKGTNPDAAIKGIKAMKWPTYLIAGGYDKGSDYREWIRSFDGKVVKLVLEGKTRFDIEKAALGEGFPKEKIVVLETMAEAMDYCYANAKEGEAVLLSPACASWGEFPNYEIRGKKFKEYVIEKRDSK